MDLRGILEMDGEVYSVVDAGYPSDELCDNGSPCPSFTFYMHNDNPTLSAMPMNSDGPRSAEPGYDRERSGHPLTNNLP
jgi:hypothetical protein